MRLTEKRLRALRMIGQRPGMYVSGLAEICEAPDLNGRPFNGFHKSRTGKQSATQWGASYAAPLVKAGLVRREFCVPGCARLWLTQAGQEAARSGAATEHAPTTEGLG